MDGKPVVVAWLPLTEELATWRTKTEPTMPVTNKTVANVLHYEHVIPTTDMAHSDQFSGWTFKAVDAKKRPVLFVLLQGNIKLRLGARVQTAAQINALL